MRAKTKEKAICNKCGRERAGAAGCSHASCGGIFVTANQPQPTEKPEFTAEEKQALAAALTKAAAAIAAVWDVQRTIEQRTGKTVTSCCDLETAADVAAHLAVGIDDPAAPAPLDPDDVATYFAIEEA